MAPLKRPPGALQEQIARHSFEQRELSERSIKEFTINKPEDLRSAHERLSQHFVRLRNDRSEHPLYFLEHGLDASDIEDLVRSVSSFCAVHPFSSYVWRNRYFPPLIVATEIGYTYRGPGKDFWPKLEERLATSISFADRHSLSVLFSEAAKIYGGAARPETPWATHFPHIAWPITHAVLPLEFHRPFAQALAALRQHQIDPTQDEPLLYAVRRAARNLCGERFRGFLADESLVLALTRHFLRIRVQNMPLTSQVLERIALDLRKDRTAARDIELAYRQRKQAATQKPKRNGVVRAGSKQELARLTGLLYLRRGERSEIHIEVVMPTLPTDIVVRARKDLRRRRFSPQLWGVSSRVPSDQILSGLPFRVGVVKSFADLSGPLLPELDAVPIDPALKVQLERLHLDLSPPLLFLERATESVARQVRGGVATVGRTYWLLLVSNSVTNCKGVQVLGTLGEMTCMRIDPDKEADRMLLMQAGIKIRFGTSVQWVGDPPAHVDAEIPEYRDGDAIVVQVSRVPPDGVSLVQAGSVASMALNSSGLVRLSGTVGAHVMELAAEGHTEQVRYTVSTRPPTHELCWINLEGEEPSVQSLLGRACVIRVDGVAPIGGLRLTLSLISDGVSVACSKQLPPLPAIIGPSDPIWDRLLTDRICDVLRTRPAIQLRAVVGGLADDEWRLEPRLRPCWWEGDGDNRHLVTETDEVPFGVVSPLRPAAEPVCAPPKNGTEGRLLVPTPADPEFLGPTAEFTGLFVAPSRLDLRLPPLDRPRMLRASSASNGGLGTQQVITAMLRWRLADAVGPIADIRRRQLALELERWLVRSVCGGAWADAEDSIDSQHSSLWEGFVVRCKNAAVGYDGYVELSRTEEVEFRHIAAQQLQISVPDLWLDALGALRSEDIYDRLDSAFLRAYEILAEHHRVAGRTVRADKVEAADPGSAPEYWDEVLLKAQSSVELRTLADLVYPTTGGDELVVLDYARTSLDDLADELAGWRRRHEAALQGRPWARDEIEAALSLWLDPERVPYTPWRTASDRFIADRWTSRAVRYVALRRRASLAS